MNTETLMSYGLHYLNLEECARYATISKATAAAVRRTPLFCVLSYPGGDEEFAIAAALLKGGANPNHINAQGEFPLLLSDCYSIVDLLLRYGAQMELRNQEGCTALHCYSMHNSTLVALLLTWGANPHCVDKKGMTALHYAAIRGTGKTIDLLLAAGARLDQKNYDGETAYDLAGDIDTRILLRQLQEEQQRQWTDGLSAKAQQDVEPLVLGDNAPSPSAACVFQIDDLVRVILSYLGVANWASLSCISKTISRTSARLIARQAREWGVARADETEAQQRAALCALWGELAIMYLFAPSAAQREARQGGPEALLRHLRALPLASCARLFLEPYYMRDASRHIKHVEASLCAAPHPIGAGARGARGRAERERLSDREVRELELASVRFGNAELMRFLVAHGILTEGKEFL